MPISEKTIKTEFNAWLSDPTQERTDTLTFNLLTRYKRTEWQHLQVAAQEACTRIVEENKQCCPDEKLPSPFPAGNFCCTALSLNNITSFPESAQSQYHNAYSVLAFTDALLNNKIIDATCTLLNKERRNSLAINCSAFFSAGQLDAQENRVQHYAAELSLPRAILLLNHSIETFNSSYALWQLTQLDNKNRTATLCLLLETQARDPLITGGFTYNSILPLPLQEAVQHFPLQKLDLRRFLQVPLSNEIKTALLEGLRNNPLITTIEPVELLAEIPGICSHLRENKTREALPFKRRHWGIDDFDEVFPGWLDGNDTDANRLYILTWYDRIDLKHATAQCKESLSDAMLSNNAQRIQRICLLLAILAKEKTAADIQLLEERAKDNDVYALYELVHRSSIDLAKKRTYSQQAAATGHPLGIQAQAVCPENRFTRVQKLAFLLPLQNHPQVSPLFKHELQSSIDFLFKRNTAAPMPVEDLCRVIEGFTQKTLILTDYIVAQYNSEAARTALQGAILKNRAITHVIPPEAVFTMTPKQKVLEGHLSLNKSLRDYYEAFKQGVLAAQSGWNQCLEPQITDSATGGRISALALAIRFGDHPFVNTLLCRLPPEVIMTIAQCGIDTPREDERTHFERLCTTQGVTLEFLRQRAKEETALWQLMTYLRTRVTEKKGLRWLQGFFGNSNAIEPTEEDRARLENAGHIFTHLNQSTNPSINESETHNRFLSFLTHQELQQVPVNTILGITATKERYHRYRTQLNCVPFPRLCERAKEQDALIDSENSPFMTLWRTYVRDLDGVKYAPTTAVVLPSAPPDSRLPLGHAVELPSSASGHTVELSSSASTSCLPLSVESLTGGAIVDISTTPHAYAPAPYAPLQSDSSSFWSSQLDASRATTDTLQPQSSALLAPLVALRTPEKTQSSAPIPVDSTQPLQQQQQLIPS